MSELAEKLAGKFIVIDGPDGAGKSTQLKLLAEHLRCQGVEVTETRDPGGTRIGDKIREILLRPDHEEMSIGCEMLLYMASRTQLMNELIGPAIASGRCVVCDRWVSSTLAYQVANGGMSDREITDVYEIALRSMKPDLTIILDLPPEEGLERIGGSPDRMEAKGPEFHRKVRELFLQQVRTDSRRFTTVDATGSEQEVHHRVRDCLLHWDFQE